jgi:predicted HTH transcriptional regulator
MNLEKLLRTPEGKTLDFKRNLSSPKGLLRTLVAFANTAGGVVLVGVEDGTSSLVQKGTIVSIGMSARDPHRKYALAIQGGESED